MYFTGTTRQLCTLSGTSERSYITGKLLLYQDMFNTISARRIVSFCCTRINATPPLACPRTQVLLFLLPIAFRLRTKRSSVVSCFKRLPHKLSYIRFLPYAAGGHSSSLLGEPLVHWPTCQSRYSTTTIVKKPSSAGPFRYPRRFRRFVRRHLRRRRWRTPTQIVSYRIRETCFYASSLFRTWFPHK